jgi:hypothetical protein
MLSDSERKQLKVKITARCANNLHTFILKSVFLTGNMAKGVEAINKQTQNCQTL